VFCRSRQSQDVLRTPSARRTRRSIRSGYAFAHQEGFGRLITSGKIMRKLPRPNGGDFFFPPFNSHGSGPSNSGHMTTTLGSIGTNWGCIAMLKAWGRSLWNSEWSACTHTAVSILCNTLMEKDTSLTGFYPIAAEWILAEKSCVWYCYAGCGFKLCPTSTKYLESHACVASQLINNTTKTNIIDTLWYLIYWSCFSCVQKTFIIRKWNKIILCL
jgi:hypothetical protein